MNHSNTTYVRRLWNAWSQVEGLQALTKPGKDCQLYKLSPLTACVIHFILLACMVRCDHIDKVQFHKDKESQKTPWGGHSQSPAQSPLELFTGSVCTHLATHFRWGSSLERWLQATGTGPSICHLELEVSWEWTLPNDWRGRERGMCARSKKAQCLHFKSWSWDYFGKDHYYRVPLQDQVEATIHLPLPEIVPVVGWLPFMLHLFFIGFLLLFIIAWVLLEFPEMNA